MRTDLGGSETILLVEDADSVRKLVRRCLTEHGYSVIDAPSGLEALRLMSHYEGKVDMLVTDVVLPRLNGHELAIRLTRQRPELRVLYMSGFPDDALSVKDVLEQDLVLIQKPFSPALLLRKVREILDEVEAEG